ncbi:hypothetical protein CAFE_02360 [Caprobacter fermentans]|uniref:Uncharacterized protein n=1 Tax=Caproicibacter fermentans TaxID=2576756 RepID=A0A6N8HVK0_9FIRM|nr:hypothetical protein [Caproicibacter fermentans]MVB09580.1 hypothetical protein [Caproicibacter fermentans]
MTCTTNKIQINGEWRDILVIQSDVPVTFANPGCIADGNTLYFTDGAVFRSEQQDGKYYYWFVINSTSTIPGLSAQISDLQNQIDALTLSTLGVA